MQNSLSKQATIKQSQRVGKNLSSGYHMIIFKMFSLQQQYEKKIRNYSQLQEKLTETVPRKHTQEFKYVQRTKENHVQKSKENQ